MKRTIKIGDNEFVVRAEDFDEDIDIDRLLKIDLSNLIGELTTFPVIVNRFGIMVAAKEREISGLKLTMDVLEAKLKESLRMQNEAAGAKAPTVEQLNSFVDRDPTMLKHRLNMNKMVEERDILQTTMWCARDKSSKLDKISQGLQPEDIKQAKVNRTQRKLID